MSAISRKKIRDRFVVLATTALVGSGKPYQAIYSHDRRDFEQENPVLLVLSAGTGRAQFGIGTSKYDNRFRLTLLSFVLEAIEDDSNWTEAHVEDKLDECEVAIADFVQVNKKDIGYWRKMFFEGPPSNVFPARVGGSNYRMEMINVIAEVQDA